MCKLLMSINPEHVDNILAGTKKFEFRKTKCKEKIDSIIIYSTFPIMRVVAEVEVKDIIEDTPQAVWSKTRTAAGIDKMCQDGTTASQLASWLTTTSGYNKGQYKYSDIIYYDGRSTAVAYVLGEVKKFSSPKVLSDYGVKAAPQSYVYVR